MNSDHAPAASSFRPGAGQAHAVAISPERLPPKRNQRNKVNPGLIFLFFGLALAAGAVLFLFDPARHAFYPACILYRTTGLQCPGCGSLRALHHLLHGEVTAALHYNALLVLSLPLLGLLAVRAMIRWINPNIRHRPLPPAVFWGAFFVVTSFGVLRNLQPFGHWFLF